MERFAVRFRILFPGLILALLIGVGGMLAWAAGSPSELRLAWWGDMGAIEYPASGRDPAVVKDVEKGLKQFRDANPDALLLDLGDFVGATCGYESVYTMPPLPYYKSIHVGAVNVSQSDWLDILPGKRLVNMPKQDPVAIVSTMSLADGKRPHALRPAALVKAGGHSVIVTGVTKIQPDDYSPYNWRLLQADQDLETAIRQAVGPLKKTHPEAPVILLADLPRDEATRLALSAGDVDLVLVNRPEKALNPQVDTPGKGGSTSAAPDAAAKALKAGAKVWTAGRYEAGKIAIAHVQLGSEGEIRSMKVEGRDFVPVEKSKGSLWTWLGLAHRRPARRILAKAPPKPIVAINLADPLKIVQAMGYKDATVEIIRCDVPQDIHEKVSNEHIIGFSVEMDGKIIGRLYRIHVLLPDNNGDLIANVIFDQDSRIVRATSKIEPMIGFRYVLLSRVLRDWEGKKPEELEIDSKKYPGYAGQLGLLRDAFVLGAEINRICW